MKRFLLALIILFQLTAFSQVPDLVNCQGTALFDLTSQENILIGTQNPSEINITYHTSYDDADLAQNAISNPSSYISSSASDPIFPRVENIITTNYTIEYFNIINNSPFASFAEVIPDICSPTGRVEINAFGGRPPYYYSISSGGVLLIENSTNNVFESLQAGNYQVESKDALGCSVIRNITVTPTPPIQMTSLNIVEPLCYNERGAVSFNITGGTPPYRIDDNGLNAISIDGSFTFTNLEIGYHNILINDDTWCYEIISFYINSPDEFVATTAVNMNSVTVNTTGGTPPYQYSVDGVTSQNSNVFSNLETGNYCFYVQDVNGCSVAPICLTIIPILDIQSNGTYQDFNNDGFVNIGDVINYVFTVTNTGSLDVTNITLDSFGLPNNGAVITTLTGGTSDNSTFTASYVLTQHDISTGSITKDFQINGTYDGSPTSTITTNTTSLSISDGIKLNAFLDTNGNNIQDNGEQNINIGSFEYQLNNGNTISVVSSTGTYYLYETNPLSTYNLSYVIDPTNATQYTLSQNRYTNVTVATNSGVTTYNFPLTIIPYVDLQVYLNQNGASPRPGFVYTERIMYRNVGNQTTSGTITFSNNNVVTITNVSEAGITSNANGFTYDFTNLLPNQIRYIFVTMQTPVIPTVALGQVLTNNVKITIPSGDVNVTNNESTLSQIIVGSFDPNDKTEAHGGKIVQADFSSEDYLTYTIQFENTGTANAVMVKVDDVLDAMLNASTIKMIDASHDYVLERDGNNVSWKFNGIDLPPSVANTPTGKGYIVFQIKPAVGYAIGDIIPNTANIYFDFNPAIVTNTFTTEFVETLSTPSFVPNNLLVYPNPTSGIVNISLSNRIAEASVMNIVGQTVLTKKINSSTVQLDLSTLPTGTYWVKIVSEEVIKTIKMIKQ